MIYKFFKHKIFHKWIFQNPNSENRKAVSEFNKWLKEHKDDYCEMYHGTDASLPILKNGLKKTSSRTKRSYQSQSGYVYLSIYPSMAKTFGEMGWKYIGRKFKCWFWCKNKKKYITIRIANY